MWRWLVLFSLMGCQATSGEPTLAVPIVLPAPEPAPHGDEPAVEPAGEAPVDLGSLDWTWSPAGSPPLEVRRGVVKLDMIRFDLNKPTVRASSLPLVDRLAAFLAQHPDIERLLIEAHTDNNGARTYNLALSRSRAHQLARDLVTRGIDCRRLVPIGYGPDRPIACNTCSPGRSPSRRVVLIIARFQGVDLVPGLDHQAGRRDPCQPAP